MFLTGTGTRDPSNSRTTMGGERGKRADKDKKGRAVQYKPKKKAEGSQKKNKKITGTRREKKGESRRKREKDEMTESVSHTQIIYPRLFFIKQGSEI